MSSFPAGGETRQARILIVDDRGDRRAWIQQALSGIARLETCESALAALEIAAAVPVDLLVWGNASDGEGGLQLADRMRREHPRADLICLYEEAPAEGAAPQARGRAVEGADVLDGPVSESQLRRLVEQTLLRRALARENHRLRGRMRALEECRVLVSCLEPGKVYPATLDLVLDLLGRGRGFSLFRRTSPLGEALAFRGFSEGEARRFREVLGEQKPIDPGRFEGIDRVGAGPLHAALREAGVECGGLLAVPLQSRQSGEIEAGEGAEAGVVWVFDDGDPFDDDELELAGIVAGYAADALANCERYQNAKERAFIDDVTEVYNARYLLSTTENEIRRAERYDDPLSVLFLDLDRFKRVNDRHGHLVGSQTLRALSQLLSQCVRGVDTLARYGGDEFTILLVGTGHDAALQIAERIRRTVEENVFEAERQAGLRLTISIGVATCPDHARSRDALLDAADKAMYRAKSLGRNRVCSAHDL